MSTRPSPTASDVTLPPHPEELAQASVSKDEAEKPAPRPRGSPGDANGSRERAPDDERNCARVVMTGSASSGDARRRAPHHEGLRPHPEEHRHRPEVFYAVTMVGYAFRLRSSSDGSCGALRAVSPKAQGQIAARGATNQHEGKSPSGARIGSPAPCAKINRLTCRANQWFDSRVSPDERGGSRSSRTCGGMRWTRWRRKTNAVVAYGEVVWS